METDSKKLHIKFDGATMEAGHIDVSDFAQTVSATADLLRFIAKGVESSKNKSLTVNLVALRPGSFEVDLVVNLKDLGDIAPGLVPLINVHSISGVKQLFEILKSLLQVKKFLKGEAPVKIEVLQNDGSPHVAIHGNTGTVNVSVNTFNLLQSEGVSKKLHKIVQPLLKEGGSLDSIEISEEGDEPIEVSKTEASYFKKEEELQTAKHRVRGVITALDRKTSNGKISIGEKRVNFEIDILDIKKLDKVVDGLIEAMKNKIAIMVIGQAVFDFESNLKHIKINDIEKEERLFD